MDEAENWTGLGAEVPQAMEVQGHYHELSE